MTPQQAVQHRTRKKRAPVNASFGVIEEGGHALRANKRQVVSVIASLVAALSTAACNPIPLHADCSFPRLHVSPSEVESTVSNTAYFSDQCTGNVPKAVRLARGPAIIDLRIRREWIDLGAKIDGHRTTIVGPLVRTLQPGSALPDPETYSFTVRADSLSNGKLEFSIDGYGEIVIPVETVMCKCAHYDAL